MSKPFDATTKELLEKDPRGWLQLLLGRTFSNVRVLNVDLSTITTEADTVLLVEEGDPWLVHVEFQTTYDPTLPIRLQRYNILVQYREGLPVLSIALLLRPEADGPAMSGLVQHRLPDGLLYHEFRYNVERIWERPVEEILSGGMGTLPLAPMALVSAAQLPEVVRRMQQRFTQESDPADVASLWTSSFILMGLVYPIEFIKGLFQGIPAMRESVTYQEILREGLAEGLVKGRVEGRAEGRVEGRVEEARRILIRQATGRFGSPSTFAEGQIERMDDPEQLEALIDRIHKVSSWDELIGEP